MIQYLHVQPLPADLVAWKDRIEALARGYGLTYPEVVFEVLGYDKLNEVAAFGGFPTRYPHWRWGMAFEQLSKSYTYGLSKIYELVINTDPCIAYLLETNEMVDQKLVMSHVYGHADFFHNNFWFSRTNRKMLDQMANHASRVRRYHDLYGQNAVEEFFDVCLSLENLIDVHRPFRPDADHELPRAQADLPDELIADADQVARMKAKEYMDDFVNPESFLKAQREKAHAESQKKKKHPESAERDVLLFLMENAPLTGWQRNVLGIVREEAYYFAPQAMTKIMNEGWASFWHTRLMTQHVLCPNEAIDYADRHSGTTVMQKGRINPYKLGLELFLDIEERWNTGRHGRDWENCDDAAERANWNTHANAGLAKVFEVRKHHNDATFLDEFLTPEFCAEQKLFNFEFDQRGNQWRIATRDFQTVKQKLLGQLTNLGQPVIEVEDANFENRSELLLVHRHDGVDLDQSYAQATLKNLHALWKRPVHLHSRRNNKGVLLSYEADKYRERPFTLG